MDGLSRLLLQRGAKFNRLVYQFHEEEDGWGRTDFLRLDMLRLVTEGPGQNFSTDLQGSPIWTWRDKLLLPQQAGKQTSKQAKCHGQLDSRQPGMGKSTRISLVAWKSIYLIVLSLLLNGV